jgi:hypothetical protein
MAYDPKCQELAEYFLPSMASERLRSELAQHIQDEIEVWMESESRRLAKALADPKDRQTE